MRNVKLLWGIILVLAAAILVLTRMAMFDKANPRPASPVAEEKAVASIGGVQISSDRLTDALYKKYGTEMLDQILDREAVRLEAEQKGIHAGDEEIDQELTKMQQGYDSEEQFYQSMKDQVGLTKEELREDVHYKLLLEKIATASIVITEGEVQAYIKSHAEEFKNIIQFRIQQIISDTLEQANKTYELAQKEDFGQLARQRSLDTNTANEGGDLGWVEDNDPFIPAPIMKAVEMMKVGDISRPIKVDRGYAVIRLKDRKEQSKGTPAQIAESVRKQLALQQAPLSRT
ncbi:peptidylprolyl isomerase [Paenibacillus sp. CC-CFT747]|nr:peptidylprolyl isomerase [Paenibacillus sp. CC-CFT747]